jgi:hypothetical protein
MQRHFEKEVLTKEERDRINTKSSLESAFRRNAIGVGDLLKARAKGDITQRQLESMIHYKNLPLLARHIKGMNPDEAYEVFQKANPQEKKLIAQDARSQFVRGFRAARTPEDRQKWSKRMIELAGPVSKEKRESDLSDSY